MSEKTGISWTESTWNPTEGCSLVSEGCRNCYAMKLANRFARDGWSQGLINLKTGKWNGTLRLAAHKLAIPLRWKRPRRIFVNSMSDLFHEALTNEEIAAVFGVIAAAPQHTFQVLTKRATRMREWFEWVTSAGASVGQRLALAVGDVVADHVAMAMAMRVDGSNAGWTSPPHWPLPNVWLGVSVENQDAADERIPELLRTPAAVRFLSCEPLLGPVTLPIVHVFGTSPVWNGPRIDWVIAGCESGPGARPCSVEWLRSLRDQCAAAGVAYFLKQAVEPSPHDHPAALLAGIRHFPPTSAALDGSKRKAGGVIELPYLDGVQHAAFPEVSP